MRKVIDIYNPLPGKTSRLVIGFDTENRRHQYTIGFNGLHRGEEDDSFNLQINTNVVVPKSHYKLPIMRQLFADDGFSPETIESSRIGARIFIVKRPGLFLGIVDTFREKVTPIVEIGGDTTTKIDEKIVFHRSKFH